MNYFINTHGFSLSLIYALIWSAIIAVVVLYFIKTKPKLSIVVAVIIIMGSLLGSVAFMAMLSSYLNQGRINRLFFTEHNEQPRLIVWLSHSQKSQNIKVFNMLSSKQLGSLNVNCEFIGLYQPKTYQPAQNLIWTKRKNNGLYLINMAKPEIIGDEKDILVRNLVLGDEFFLYGGDYAYDPYRQVVTVTTLDSSFYEINANLEAKPVKDVYVRPWKAKYRPPRIKSKLLDAKAVQIMNPEQSNKNKYWVMHYSTIFKDADPLLSYVDLNGKILNTIKLRDIFDSKQMKALYSLTYDDQVWVFVSAKNFNLMALITDANTGEIKRRITYL